MLLGQHQPAVPVQQHLSLLLQLQRCTLLLHRLLPPQHLSQENPQLRQQRLLQGVAPLLTTQTLLLLQLQVLPRLLLLLLLLPLALSATKNP
jgi:hypothetical protein